MVPLPVTTMPAPGTEGYQWVGEGLTHNEVGIPVSGASAHVAQITDVHGGHLRHHRTVEVVALARLVPGQGLGAGGSDGGSTALAFASGVGEGSVGRVESREQGDGGLGPEAAHAGQVVGRVAPQCGEIRVLLGTYAGDQCEPRRIQHG